MWVHDDKGSKLEGCSKIGKWVGFDEESTHAHRIYWSDRLTVSVERNVKFDENSVLIPNVDMLLEGEIEECRKEWRTNLLKKTRSWIPISLSTLNHPSSLLSPQHNFRDDPLVLENLPIILNNSIVEKDLPKGLTEMGATLVQVLLQEW